MTLPTPPAISGAGLPGSRQLRALPALGQPDLLAPSVAAALVAWEHGARVAVVEIEPELADTASMSEAYGLPLTVSVNCVLVAGSRAGQERIAACVVRADTRVDVNTLVKRSLDVRKVSFLPMERAMSEAAMEHGGITPLGLPAPWRVLVDPVVARIPVAVLGSGVRRSKLLVFGAHLAALPRVELTPGLGR